MIEIDWNSLYAWPGYDFWGVTLAIFGFAFSIFFAFSANSSAKVAAEAAKNARLSMSLLDTSSQLTLVQQHLVELRLRVEAAQWEQVSEKCEEIRKIVAPILSSDSVTLGEATEKGLISLQSQMASLQKTADEVRHDGSDFSMVKIKSVLAKQGETVARAIREFKDKTELGHNV